MKRLPKPKITEKDITRWIRHFLKLNDIYHWKHWQGGFTAQNGVSDILGLVNGRFLAIEVKKPGGKLSKKQIEFIEQIRKHGGIAFKAESVKDVIKYLTKEGIKLRMQLDLPGI